MSIDEWLNLFVGFSEQKKSSKCAGTTNSSRYLKCVVRESCTRRDSFPLVAEGKGSGASPKATLVEAQALSLILAPGPAKKSLNMKLQ